MMRAGGVGASLVAGRRCGRPQKVEHLPDRGRLMTSRRAAADRRTLSARSSQTTMRDWCRPTIFTSVIYALVAGLWISSKSAEPCTLMPTLSREHRPTVRRSFRFVSGTLPLFSTGSRFSLLALAVIDCLTSRIRLSVVGYGSHQVRARTRNRRHCARTTSTSRSLRLRPS